MANDPILEFFTLVGIAVGSLMIIEGITRFMERKSDRPCDHVGYVKSVKVEEFDPHFERFCFKYNNTCTRCGKKWTFYPLSGKKPAKVSTITSLV